jgi:hypothetical protein
MERRFIVEEFLHLTEKTNKPTLLEAASAVVILWVDIYDYKNETWVDFPLDLTKFKPAEMRTIGYLIGSTGDSIIVCSTIDLHDDLCSTVSVIPNGCIRNITVL